MLQDSNDFFDLAYNTVNKCSSPTASPSPSRHDQLQAPRPLRRCRSASPVPPPKAPLLSAERQTLIRKSWQRVPKLTFGESLMADLLSRIGRAVFGEDTTVVERHRRYFIELIQTCVDNLSDLESALRPWLDTLGKGHAGFKIKARHWEAFSESLLFCVTEWVGPGRSHKETVKGWMVLSSFLADRLAAASRSSHSPMVTPRVQLMTFAQP